MKQNVHTYDRIARILIALAVGGLYLADQISGIAAIVLGIVSIAFVITGFVGFCPIYYCLKFSTKKKENAAAA
jgi:uncharacterized membrane protein YuzA (DUF378 family)